MPRGFRVHCPRRLATLAAVLLLSTANPSDIDAQAGKGRTSGETTRLLDSLARVAQGSGASANNLAALAEAQEYAGSLDTAVALVQRLAKTSEGLVLLDQGLSSQLTWRVKRRLVAASNTNHRDRVVHEEIARLLPNSAAVLERLAYSRGHDGDSLGAVQAIDRALALDHGTSHRRFDKATILRLFRPQLARAWLDTLVETAQDDSRTHYELARWGVTAGDEALAARAYLRYLQLVRQEDHYNPFHLMYDQELVTKLVTTHLGRDQLLEALRDLAAKDSTDWFIHEWLGEELVVADKYEEALIVLRRAIAAGHDPSVQRAMPQFHLGNALFGLRRYEEAFRAFATAYQRDTSLTTALFNQGAALSNLGRLKEALSAYGRYVLRSSDDVAGWVRMGVTAYRLERSRDAAALLERAQELDPQAFDTLASERRAWELAIAQAGQQPPATLADVRGMVSGTGAITRGPASRGAPAAAAPKRPGTNPSQSPAPGTARAEAVRSTGSGFVVGSGGEVLTNAHVVSGCGSLRLTASGAVPVAAKLMARDEANDLALLLAQGLRAPPLTLRTAGVRPGEMVVTTGFPLSSLLAAQPVTSTGTVAALAGLGNDARLLQISAPVQAGNSGGPALDADGAVIGVVVSKLDAARVYAATGDLPQNVNFAIKASIARAFLEAQGLTPRASSTSASQRTTPEVAALGRAATVYIECLR